MMMINDDVFLKHYFLFAFQVLLDSLVRLVPLGIEGQMDQLEALVQWETLDHPDKRDDREFRVPPDLLDHPGGQDNGAQQVHLDH